MDYYLSEQQIEELVNFDQHEDLSDLIEEEQEFNINEYLNSNIDYWVKWQNTFLNSTPLQIVVLKNLKVKV